MATPDLLPAIIKTKHVNKENKRAVVKHFFVWDSSLHLCLTYCEKLCGIPAVIIRV